MSQKIIFLDRDGVINKYPGHGDYVLKKEDLVIFQFFKAIPNKWKNNQILFF